MVPLNRAMQRSGAGVGEHSSRSKTNRAASGLLPLTKFSAPLKPMLSGLRHKIIAVAVLAALAPAWTASVFARRTADVNGAISAGTIINRAESVYEDDFGTKYSAVSQTVSVTVLAVSALVVTPDETEPSATIAPHERITRLFSICNAGNIPDTYTITRAEVSAPAQIVNFYFDVDKSGTVSDGDLLIRAGEGATPQLARGACVGLLAVVDTNATEPGSRLSISVTARSNAVGASNGAAEDAGTIINTVGNGVRFSAPDDARLQPVK
ncbi:MAG TPA: hypothetical protein VM870_06430, partial [Pyrinomonadaceae bacterium]|nr:hypothetical protein [Pyrinomonadaceae bacterium]